MTIGNKSKHKELAWEFLKMLTSDSSIQREIFEYSQGASVLKYVTGSRYAESMIRKDMRSNCQIAWRLNSIISFR